MRSGRWRGVWSTGVEDRQPLRRLERAAERGRCSVAKVIGLSERFGLGLGDLMDETRHRRQAGELGGRQPLPPSNDGVSRVALAYEERLDDPERPDRTDQGVELA